MSISTHVLDTERGEPARGLRVSLARHEGTRRISLVTHETDGDGRVTDLIGGPLVAGVYQVSFDVARYYHQRGQPAPFFRRFVVEVQIADTERHYHIPLLLSAYSATTYRGS